MPARNHAYSDDEIARIKSGYQELRAEQRRRFTGFVFPLHPGSIHDVEPAERFEQLERHWEIGGLPFLGAFGDTLFDWEANRMVTDYWQGKIRAVVDDPEIAYLMRRFRQTHDVWHALVDLGTAGHEEVILHAFSWGQLRLPVSAMVVIFGGLKHIVLEARWEALRHTLGEAYRHGRDALPLLPVYWERLWEEPLEAVRARYRVVPCKRV